MALIMNRSDELLILISFAGIEDQLAVDAAPQPKRIYAIVGLSYSVGAFQVIEKKIQKVPYQSVCCSVHFCAREVLITTLRLPALVRQCTLGCSCCLRVVWSVSSSETLLFYARQVSMHLECNSGRKRLNALPRHRVH